MNDHDLDLGPARHESPTDQRQILCLSGGGYRGLYTALVLEAPEQRAGRRLADVFDVLAGTSIGALIAAALALRLPAADIRSEIETRGPAIFDRRLRLGTVRLPLRRPFRGLLAARYSQKPLREAIDAIFGSSADQPLSRVATPLVVSAVDARTGSPQLLLSAGLAGKRASELPLRDALLATSAAPTYFPPHRFRDRVLVDGGLVANAPDLVAVTETVRNLGCDLQQVRALSVGTAGAPREAPPTSAAPGLVGWLVRHGLVQPTLSAQERLAVDQCAVLLGDRYLRLDHAPAVGEPRLGLEDADAASADALERAAATTIASFSGSNRAAVRRFLAHASLGPRRPPVALP